MRPPYWMAAIAVALIACAQTESARSNDVAAQAVQPTTPAPSPAGAYSDAQLQAFIAANNEIEALDRGATPEQQQQYTQQVVTILERNSIAPDVYNGIVDRSRTDTVLAERIATLRVSNLTDEQLRAFAAAASEIDPISRSLTAQSTAEERAAASDRIGAVLARHNIDAATYNAIAERAQTDPALAARISALHQQQ